MADENKDRSKPIASGMEPGPTEHLRDDMARPAGTSLTGSSTGSMTGAGTGTGGDGFRTAGAGGVTGQTGAVSNESGAGMAASARQYAGDIAGRAKEKGRSLFEQQKESALGQVGSVAHAIRNTASNLQGEGQDQTARYVQMIADQLESLGGRLRNKDLDTLLRDAQGLARRSPTTLLVGSVVAGFLLARFLKSSSQQQYERSDWSGQQRGMGMGMTGDTGSYTTGTTGTTGTPTSTAVGADGTPGTASGGAGVATGGLNGSNLGGNRL